jgi:hypothetical protein
VVAIGAGSVGATTVEPAGDGAASGAVEAEAPAGAAGRATDAVGVLAIGIVTVDGTAGVVWIAGVEPTEADPGVGTAAIGAVADAAPTDGAAVGPAPADDAVVVVAEPTTSTAAAAVDADGASEEPAADAAAWVGATRPAAGAWAAPGAVAGAGFAADLPRRVARAWPALETAGLSSTRELERRPDRVGPAEPVETGRDPVAESPRFREVTAC